MKSIKLTLFVLACFIQLIKSNIIVKSAITNQTIEQFLDLPATFGPNLPSNGLLYYAVRAIPINGCVPSPRPPQKVTTTSDNLIENSLIASLLNKKYVLLIERNNCSFEQKVRNAQKSGFNAAIVFNVDSDELEQMSAKTGGNDIVIPSVFVGASTGLYLVDGYSDHNEFYLIINDDIPFNINIHLILPFSILVGSCFIIMIVYVIYKCAREQRRIRQYRLPKRLLKKIPTIKFSEGDPYETCVICLEDYEKGERLRVLPCAHAYHCHCIDTWLTKNRRVCPICKRKVFARNVTGPVRNRQVSSDSTSDTDDDTQPLINPNTESSNNHGTFVSSNQQLREVEPVTDEENILVNSNRVSQRINPFDREPNLPENIANNLNVSMINQRRSIWDYPIFRLFRRSNTNEVVNPGLNSIINTVSNEISISVTVPSTASNNILNSNLSGSFKEDDDDEAIIAAPSTDLISNNNNNRTSNVNRQRDVDSSSSDVFYQTPPQGRLGVAALPNINFQQQLSQTNRFRDGVNSRNNFNI